MVYAWVFSDYAKLQDKDLVTVWVDELMLGPGPILVLLENVK